MHVDHNMHVIGCNMHITCTLFRIGLEVYIPGDPNWAIFSKTLNLKADVYDS